MKHLFLTFLTAALLLTTRPAAAQTVFAPLGAEWWYEAQGLIIPPIPYTHLRVVGDSLVGGQWARKILEEVLLDTGAGFYLAYTSYYFVRTVGDDVLSWDAAAGTYQLEFRFNRPIGTMWSMPGCLPGSTLDYQVDSVRQVPFGNALLRQQFNSTTSPRAGSVWALERVGSLGGVLFFRPQCGPGVPEGADVLLSYTDGTVSLGSVPVLHRAEPLPFLRLTVSPNPAASGRFRFDGLPGEPIRYAVVDGRGRRVCAGQLSGAAPEINLSGEAAGLYLVRGELNGQAFTRRLVRE